ncbi:MAG: GGDEF domain-containing protein, partial [Caulobacteraceae bacterium]|nr:GGDEF domain-containing protein [Caulobacteraceae bacterium]
MSGDIDTAVRGPEAYALAHHALDDMQRRQIWPTPLNYELWLHFVANPDGPLGQEIERLLADGSTLTEEISESLAAAYLPRAKLNDQIRDAGVKLNRELASVAHAIKQAQTSNEQYGETLAIASRDLEADVAPVTLKELVENLSAATRQVQQETRSLEQRLSSSSSEVARLREHLEQVRREATTDALTKLANRKAFDEEVARACAD